MNLSDFYPAHGISFEYQLINIHMNEYITKRNYPTLIAIISKTFNIPAMYFTVDVDDRINYIGDLFSFFIFILEFVDCSHVLDMVNMCQSLNCNECLSHVLLIKVKTVSVPEWCKSYIRL